MKNDIFLVQFTYDYYCHVYENAPITVLVKNVPSFEAAINRIKILNKWINPRDFINLTIDI